MADNSFSSGLPAIRPIGARTSPKKYVGVTEADSIYQQGLNQGLDAKTAAKQAQAKTGLSLLTGRPMKTRGFGWQTPITKIQVQ